MTRSKAALTASALLLTTALVGTGPASQPASDVVYLDQGWEEPGRRWFYHTTQGTRLLPMAWFLALEQPKSDAAEAPRFAAPDHLARFGFLVDPPSNNNPHGLPVGFAEDERPENGEGAREPAMVGLTCAACHTGQVEHRGRRVRIDGGPAMVDFDAFSKTLGAALIATGDKDKPERFDRFAVRVIQSSGLPDTPAVRERLRQELGKAIAGLRAEAERVARLNLQPVAEGPGRLDALGRAGNVVFGLKAGEPRNYAPADAPVSYPPLWGTPWFQWAQYNASIGQPMARNVSEALGVRAEVRLTAEESTRFASTVRMDEIFAMEQFLAGTDPKEGLRPPPWPERELGPIDRAKAERGAALYRGLCAGCHEGHPARSALGRYEIRLTAAPLQQIGTDPKAALNFTERTVHLPWELNGPIAASEALRRVTNGVMNRWYGENRVGPEDRWMMGGQTDNEWRAAPEYRARPLNGVWATAPYLHNGSVPNLYEMLLPAHRRSPEFHVGGREFDPARVGFDASPAEGRFRFDTSLPGNSNRGHEFRDGPRGNGVIGRALSDGERLDLIEFLKTL